MKYIGILECSLSEDSETPLCHRVSVRDDKNEVDMKMMGPDGSRFRVTDSVHESRRRRQNSQETGE